MEKYVIFFKCAKLPIEVGIIAHKIYFCNHFIRNIINAQLIVDSR